MSIGSMIGFAFTVFTNIPKIISIVKSITDLVKQLKPAEQTEAFSALKNAYVSAKKGDATELNVLHQDLAKKCEGAACPADTVGLG